VEGKAGHGEGGGGPHQAGGKGVRPDEKGHWKLRALANIRRHSDTDIFVNSAHRKCAPYPDKPPSSFTPTAPTAVVRVFGRSFQMVAPQLLNAAAACALPSRCISLQWAGASDGGLCSNSARSSSIMLAKGGQAR